jgi:EpsI family protein
VAFFPLVYAHLQQPVTDFSVALEGPAARAGWERLQEDVAPAYRPTFKGQRGEVLQRYRAADGAVVQLYMAYYAEQRNGEEMVMTVNSLDGHEREGWRRLRSGDDRLPVGPVRQAVLKRGDDYVRTWSWYWIDGRVLSNPYLAQGLLALAHLSGRRDDAAVIVVSVVGGEGGEGGRETAETFVREYVTAIDAMLVDAGARR